MANDEHVAKLKEGVEAWNTWRNGNPDIDTDLSRADLSRADLSGAHLSGADLSGADLFGANLSGANLFGANLSGANLSGAHLNGAHLMAAYLRGADLSGADLRGANLYTANLAQANLSGANLRFATLVRTNLTGTDLTGCRVYGVSAWGLKLERTEQQNLVITRQHEPTVTVDNIEVAQFVYLMLNNEKIRDVIDTIGKKGVLLLGRFTEGRIAILERLREELRKRDFLPIVFNFDKPDTKTFTQTVRLLAGMSRFVIADVTNPRSAPLELQATVPELMVPFRPIIEEGEKPFAMLEDLWIQYREWVFEPLYYSSPEALVAALDEKIIKPAEIRFAELLARKAERMKGEHI
jgi:Pentapeptide repeats (8 copies)